MCNTVKKYVVCVTNRMGHANVSVSTSTVNNPHSLKKLFGNFKVKSCENMPWSPTSFDEPELAGGQGWWVGQGLQVGQGWWAVWCIIFKSGEDAFLISEWILFIL